MIPIIINNDIPFPIPLSVIFSPNHIAKMVPVVRINTERSEEHTSELQSRPHLVCRLLLEKKNPRPAPRVGVCPRARGRGAAPLRPTSVPQPANQPPPPLAPLPPSRGPVSALPRRRPPSGS